MSKTRDNHYVAQWYQEGFFDQGRNNFHYLDLHPQVTKLPNGREFTAKHKFTSYTSQCFYATDLYSTFFGKQVNDEIERRLFGPIDASGSKAVKAFIGTDVDLWMQHFQQFFEYIDAQKFRTPKGLEWLKHFYPLLNQNDLMQEMQGIQRMNCTLWTEGVREIVSAEKAGMKFIVTDHPVTVYNYAVPPAANESSVRDPPVSLKGSQTIFPLNKEFCLILTHLEYAKKPEGVSPTEKRTFARNYRSSMVRTDAFIRSRQLDDIDVARINLILKSQARKYIAAGREEWLYPERLVTDGWADLRKATLPPKDGQWLFGGEMYAKFQDGEVYYQDEFGRTEKPRDFLLKNSLEGVVGPNDPCGCGSGKKFKKCCLPRPKALRPSWTERSIRERNMALYRGVTNILGLNDGKDWSDIRKELTDDQIVNAYSLYEALWPLETDILDLLPKPDGRARGVFTGFIEPQLLAEFAVGSCLYFEELLIEHPFLHPGTLRKEFNPLKHPSKFHQEFLKSAFILITLMPLIEDGVINLVPDPCTFDHHLRQQMFKLAEQRLQVAPISLDLDPRAKWLMAQEGQRGLLAMPREVRKRQINKYLPELSESDVENVLQAQQELRENDHFASLNDNIVQPGKDGGFLQNFKMAPNLELTLFLARATGAFVVTDSLHRWHELKNCQARQQGLVISGAPDLCGQVQKGTHQFIWDVSAVSTMRRQGDLSDHRALIKDMCDYAVTTSALGTREKMDRQLSNRYKAVNGKSQKIASPAATIPTRGRMTCIIPVGGINHNNVSRMLLTSGAEHYTDSVPMAFFVENTEKDAYRQNLLK